MATTKATFYIHYNTRWGEDLYIMFNNDRHSAVAMAYTPGAVWTATIQVGDNTRELRYRYIVKVGSQVVREEQCPHHAVQLTNDINHYRIQDCWDDNTSDTATGNDLISELLTSGDSKQSPTLQPGTVVITTHAPLRNRRMRLAVVGEAPAMGQWQPQHAIAMQRVSATSHRAVFQLPPQQAPTQFKLIMVAASNSAIMQWEQGENRWLHHAPHPDEVTLVNGLRFNAPQLAWNMVGTRVRLTDLASDHDMGMGDLGDLKKLIQWTHATGQDALAITTLADDTTVLGWMPQHVQQAVAAHAINPLYLRPSLMGQLSNKRLKAQYQQAAMALEDNRQERASALRTLKEKYAYDLFQQTGASTCRSRAYRNFVSNNAHWLKPYAAQCLLRRINDTTDSTRWGNYAQFDPARIDRFLKGRHHEAAFLYFMQFHLYQQLQQAIQLAASHNIRLMCDMTASPHLKLMDAKEPWTCEKFIEQRLRDNGGLTLIPLHDWLLTDGNFAARVAPTSNRPVTLEELVAATDFNRRIAALITRTRS